MICASRNRSNAVCQTRFKDPSDKLTLPVPGVPSNGGSATKDVPDGFKNGILVITNPGVTQGEADEETKKLLEIMSAAGIPVSYDNAKLVYCTLEWFVDKINKYYI